MAPGEESGTAQKMKAIQAAGTMRRNRIDLLVAVGVMTAIPRPTPGGLPTASQIRKALEAVPLDRDGRFVFPEVSQEPSQFAAEAVNDFETPRVNLLE